jgi:hypothetical protein
MKRIFRLMVLMAIMLLIAGRGLGRTMAQGGDCGSATSINPPTHCVLGGNEFVYTQNSQLFPTLSDAIIAADSLALITGRACVRIAAGTYNELVELPGIKNVTIYGNIGSRPLIYGRLSFADFQNVEIYNIDWNGSVLQNRTPGLFFIEGQGLDLRGTTVSHASGYGVVFIRSSSAQISNNVVDDSGANKSGSGIGVLQSSVVNVVDNYVCRSGFEGIEIDSSDDVNVLDNHTLDNCDCGIGVSDLTTRCIPFPGYGNGCGIEPICSHLPVGVVIQGNTTTQNCSCGIGSDGASGIIIADNTISNNGASCTCQYPTGASQMGIYVITSTNIDVHSNTISGHSCAGIVVNKSIGGLVDIDNNVTGPHPRVLGLSIGVIFPDSTPGHIFHDLSTPSAANCTDPFIGCGGWDSAYNPNSPDQRYKACCTCGTPMAMPTSTAGLGSPTSTPFPSCDPTRSTP